MFATNFSGRIIQYVEALDYGDAVSNQVVNLDEMFKGLGFESKIYSMWHNESVGHLREDINDYIPRETDVLIFHYAGYSEVCDELLAESYCTKILLYHNITPAEFFSPASDAFAFCKDGREQLERVLKFVHQVWGDSQYNCDEIIELGFPRDLTHVVPIIIDRPEINRKTTLPGGKWVFLGRLAPNKGHIELLQLFNQVRQSRPELANELKIVGRKTPGDEYFSRIEGYIKDNGLSDCVHITGKVSDDEVNSILDNSDFYVSCSQHEGFGVPLIEAAYHGLPVFALSNTAISETVGANTCTALTIDDLYAQIIHYNDNVDYSLQFITNQSKNKNRFKSNSVKRSVIDALSYILPKVNNYNTLSVVICTYNRATYLERCLTYLSYQSNLNFEVVVVNGPSTDGTDQVLEKFQSRIKVVHNPQRNLSMSRNLGFEHASGQLVAFIDDDALPFDDWVQTLFDEFNARPTTFSALGGPAFYSGTLRFQSEDIAINNRAETIVNVQDGVIGKNGWCRSMLGTNTCFRRDLAFSLDGFDEQYDYFLDESEISYRLQRANYLVGYSSNLHLRHEFAQSDNRKGNYTYNWYTICKNTVYYIASYSGLEGSELNSFIETHIYQERIRPLEYAFQAGEISEAQLNGFLEDIRQGVAVGLSDYSQFPKTRALCDRSNHFLPFTIMQEYPIVGRDLRPLHICIVSKEFPPFVPGGGIGTLYYHLVSELLLMGHFVTVVTPGDLDSTYVQGRFAIRYVRTQPMVEAEGEASPVSNNLNWSLNAFNAVADINADNPIDVIDSALWDTEALAIAAFNGSRPPVVVRLVTPLPVAERINNWSMPEHILVQMKDAEKSLISLADAVVPISDSIEKTICAEYDLVPDFRWRKIPCGIAYWPTFDNQSGYDSLTEINGQPLNFGSNDKIVLFLGRLEGRKGVDQVLKASVEFLAACPESHLVLAGKDIGGWSERIFETHSDEIRSRVHFFGEVDDATRDKLLKAAYCLVFPSRYESFGLVPLEAFVHGTPVVANNAGAIPEVVEDDLSGLIYETDSVKSLTSKILELLRSKNLRDKLSKGALNRARKLSSRNSAIESISLYYSLLKDKVQVRRGGGIHASAFHKNIVETKSFAFKASNRRLMTQVGSRNSSQIVTTDKQGFLLYGPYQRLEIGLYKVTVFGSATTVCEGDYLDVVCDKSESPLSFVQLCPSDEKGVVGSCDIYISEEAIVETRIWVNSTTKISIASVLIEHQPDF